MIILLKNKHSIRFDEFIFRCCIGKNGITNFKKEGDLKTPRGTFQIENLYYRKDRLKKPKTKLKCIEIKKNMAWCDDVNSKKFYNKLIREKFHVVEKDNEKIYFHPKGDVWIGKLK